MYKNCKLSTKKILLKIFLFLIKFGLNPKMITLLWTTNLFLMLIEDSCTNCIADNLKLINIFYVNFAVSTLFILDILLIMIVFIFKKDNYNNNHKKRKWLEIIFKDKRIGVSPIFMLFMFSVAQIFLYICKFDFTNEVKNINMLVAVMVFLYSSTYLLIYKKTYQTNLKQIVIFKIILTAITPIVFICFWSAIIPYIKEIINFLICIIEH
ncbi:hypothetical protein [Sulfurimonas sp.]